MQNFYLLFFTFQFLTLQFVLEASQHYFKVSSFLLKLFLILMNFTMTDFPLDIFTSTFHNATLIAIVFDQRFVIALLTIKFLNLFLYKLSKAQAAFNFASGQATRNS